MYISIEMYHGKFSLSFTFRLSNPLPMDSSNEKYSSIVLFPLARMGSFSISSYIVLFASNSDTRFRADDGLLIS